MADTTTTLNPGVGGDTMDESLVTQAGGTSAKRPRVVVGNDLGQLIDEQQTIDTLRLVLMEMQRQTELMRLLLSNLTSTAVSLDELDAIRGA